MDTKSWQARLERTFLQDGVIGGHLQPVLKAESKCREFVVGHFHGQSVLGDSFQAFFVDTLRLAEARRQASPKSGNLPWYSYLLLLELANFRTIRAAEILYTNGRAGQGYGLLRDLKDRAILVGAVGNRFTTLKAISGLDGQADTPSDFVTYTNAVRKRRRKAEAETQARMAGASSGLSTGTILELRRWEELFHLEVHGGRITSVFEDEGWVKGLEPLPILPKPDMFSLANYMNRFSEVCWMVLRTLPLLQLNPHDFGADWAEK